MSQNLSRNFQWDRVTSLNQKLIVACRGDQETGVRFAEIFAQDTQILKKTEDVILWEDQAILKFINSACKFSKS